MKVQNAKEVQEKRIDTFPYRGKPLVVKDVTIRWLSLAGAEDSPEYGLRFFTVGPGGEIPIHNHLYYQTVYILTGRITARSHDPETDEVTAEREVGPHDFVFIPTMEPHSLKNPSDSEECTFLCCIANVYEEE